MDQMLSGVDKMVELEIFVGQQTIPAKEQAGYGGDNFYLIRDGAVDVSQIVDGSQKKVAELMTGDFFGEAALMTGDPRNATVVTKRDTVLYGLDKEEFQAALSTSDSFEQELRKALFERQ